MSEGPAQRVEGRLALLLLDYLASEATREGLHRTVAAQVDAAAHPVGARDLGASGDLGDRFEAPDPEVYRLPTSPARQVAKLLLERVERLVERREAVALHPGAAGAA